jgi:predicted Zn-dependent peptidase
MANLMRPALRQDDFDMEKKVILEEIALYEDSPGSVLQRQAIQSYYGHHPLSQEILGTTESIQALSRDQMKAYYDLRYSPGNLVLAVVGNFDPDAIHALAQQYCGSWLPTEAGRDYPDFAPKAQEVALTKSNVTRLYGVFLSPAPAYQDSRNEAMDLLVDVLGHPGNSRLHWALVDKGLVDYAGASYHAQDQEGVAGVSFSCDPEKVDDVKHLIHQEIQTLIQDGVQAQELESARNRILTSLATEGEQSLRRLFTVSFDALYLEPYRNRAESLAAYEKVTLDDLHALLKEFPFSPQTIATMGPE